MVYMKMSDDTVRGLALLSSIELGNGDLAKFSDDLEKIVDITSMLSELDTTGVEPTCRVVDLVNIWREDKVERQVLREELLKLAPERTKTAVKVPRVL
jgi:aspartyl-tRNA(Asn)/glutamyl-tRNA(Gln) amidotransferase subunit C